MYADVNGIKLYYEKSGSGKPIVLLHGNSQSHKIFGTLTRELEKNYTVYAPDSRDHGKSTRVKELNYIDIAADIAAFIKETVGEKACVYGFSDGAIVALLLAIHYPDCVSSVIASGANSNPDGVKHGILNFFRCLSFIMPSKMRMMLTQPDITAEQLRSISVPVHVIAGSKDIIKEEDTRFIAGNINGSTLKILDGEGHSSYVNNSEKLYHVIKEYLD